MFINRWKIRIITCSLIAILSACDKTPNTRLGQETVQPGEEQIVRDISKLLIGHLQEQYRGEKVLRDTHPKSNGCIKSTFKVDKNIPEKYQFGIFQPGKSYPTWMRFSNSVEEITNDEEKDFRGLAIKLFKVEGKRLPEPGDEDHTQDFLFLGHDGFFAANAQEFFDFFDASFNGKSTWFLLTHPRGAYNIFTGSKTYVNPLSVNWNSVTPYALGPKDDNGTYQHVVRYAMRSCSRNSGTLNDHPSPNYLQENLQKQLKNNRGCLEFLIQLQKDPQKMPVENALISWNQKDSPFLPIARIDIPSQTFTSPNQKEFCENISFNPWHGLQMHRPLGSVNRARRVVMKDISDFRLQQNGVTRKEPTGTENF